MPDPRPQPADDLHTRNAELLLRFHRSGDHRLRNRLVELNLSLVRQVAARLSPSTTLPVDDLVQLGCLGLIRAIEAFDPARSTTLSTFAVPYIRGAMLHHLRDVEQPLRCSRQLRELHRRGQVLQQQRLHRRLPPLGEAALAAALGCRPQRWQEALQLHRALRVRSLDAPCREGDGPEGGLLEQLPAREQPHPYRADHQLASLCCEPESQQWVRTRLDRLEPGLRRLMQERVLQGASWRRLGERQGLRARTAQRRFQALLLQLRQELQELVEATEAAPAWPERAGMRAVAGSLRSPASPPAPLPAASPAQRR